MRPIATALLAALASILTLALALPVTPAAAAGTVVISDGRSILSIPARGGAVRRLAPAPRKTSDLAATEDGRWVVAVSNRGAPGPSPGRGRTEHLRQLYLIGPQGNLRAVLPRVIRTAGDDKVAISPDGRLIAYGRENEIWVVRRDGTGNRQVTDADDGAAIDPVFIPGGQALLFARFIGLRAPRIFRIRLAGGAEVPLTPAGRNSQAPTVSTRGRIAYLEKGGESMRVRTMRGDGGSNRIVFRSSPGETLYDPDFSPDGKSIVLAAGRGKLFDRRSYSIFSISATGRDRRTVLNGLGDHHLGPVWTR